MWMGMLDFIFMGSAKLFGTDRERQIQNENKCFQRDSNPRRVTPRQVNQRLRPRPRRLDDYLWFNLLQDSGIEID